MNTGNILRKVKKKKVKKKKIVMRGQKKWSLTGIVRKPFFLHWATKNTHKLYFL